MHARNRVRDQIVDQMFIKPVRFAHQSLGMIALYGVSSFFRGYKANKKILFLGGE